MSNKFDVKTIKKQWTEPFSFDWDNIDINLIDFWSWNTSDLLNNAMRWKLAEYIIAKALWVDDWFRIEWDEYDVEYNDLKIEIKSWAYIQSWEQEQYSQISLSIRQTFDDETAKYTRPSDIYIFAILSHKDARTIDPMKLEQRDFYIVETSKIDKELWTQKQMWLSTLLWLEPVICKFDKLKENIDKLK